MNSVKFDTWFLMCFS